MMKIIRTEKQKDNSAKFFWDMAKVAFTLFVIGSFATPESFSWARLLTGTALGFLLALLGYFLDGTEVSK